MFNMATESTIFHQNKSKHLTVWKSHQKPNHHFYGKINIFSVKSTFSLKKLSKSWFHGKIAWSRCIHSTFPHCDICWCIILRENDLTKFFTVLFASCGFVSIWRKNVTYILYRNSIDVFHWKPISRDFTRAEH